MSEPDQPSEAERRTRGSRAGLSLAGIVEAARGLDPRKITVKAVADRLGVDRAAIHHHVSDLDGLRELVAGDAFTLQLTPVSIPPGAGWREACRLLALSMYDAVLTTKGLGAYVRLNGIDIRQLESVEETLRIMMKAGFDDETAARSLATLATLASASARERILARRSTGHPQVSEVRRVLDDEGNSELHNLSRLTQTDVVSFDFRQLETSIDLLLDGMAVRLAEITHTSS